MDPGIGRLPLTSSRSSRGRCALPGRTAGQRPSCTAAAALLVVAGWTLAAAGAAFAATDDAPPFYITEDVAAQESARKIAAFERIAARGAPPATANQQDWDATYYRLDLTPDHTAQLLTGTVETRGRVLSASLTQVELDLTTDMTVSAVRAAGLPTTFTHTQDLLTIDLDHTYVTGEVFAVEVDYQGNPAGDAFGWDWHSSQPMTWTLSEPFGAREWWPCKDQPADKADSVDVLVTVPTDMVVASNGALVSDTPNGATHTYHWHEGYAITTYLVSMAIHPYTEFYDYYHYSPSDSMQIHYFVYPDHFGSVQATYALVPNMIGIYAGMYGEYPFINEKYGHAEFEWGGGMEHQTCTSLGGWGEMLIAHELAHSWWGDYVTCNDFHHVWLNEGFATYSEALYLEQQYGAQAMHDDMAANAYYGPGTIYVEDTSNFGEIFNSNLSYRKASWVLHMLRHAVGDTDFFQILQTYYTQYGQSTATTEQFQTICEQVSGLDLNAYFQQWIYGEGYPIYLFDWTAQDLGGGSWQVTLDLNQMQTNQLFVMPIDVEIELAGGGTDLQVVQNDAATQQFVLQVADEPVAVRLDPDNWILRQVMVPISNPTFDQGILLVNGVDWDVYGTEIRQAYEDQAFWGDHTIAFWDYFDAPAGGYPSTLPAPLGHGAVDPDVMGQYSSVIWIGNNYNGDLNGWLNSPNLSYMWAGGNLLLMTRMGSDFLTDPLRDYLGVQWIAERVNLNSATAVYPGLGDMSRIGSQSFAAIFDKDALGAETTLLFTDVGFNPDAGIGAWRQSADGDFVFLSGRPYRWTHSQLQSNVEFILTNLFGEGTGTGVAQGGTPGAYRLRLGQCVPNPMNPSTRVPFELPAAGPAAVRVYDVGGRLVRSLIDGALAAGPQSVVWDGRNAAGQEVGSGVYYIRLEAAAGRTSRSVVLLR